MAFILTASANAQRYMTRTGYVQFYSHAPLEDIQADNRQVASAIDLSTGEIVFQVLIRSFRFEKALMEEHFNENYMESDKYPRATFTGKITDPPPSSIKGEGKYEVTVEGDLNIHNVTNRISTSATLEIKNNSLIANSKFIISPADYNIRIPAIVRDNIAKEIEVTVGMKYTPVETN